MFTEHTGTYDLKKITETSSSPAEVLCRKLFDEIGEDPLREGLVKTPERFRRAFLEVTQGGVEANHMCMAMRGVKKINSATRTFFEVGFDNLSSEEKDVLRKEVRFK